MEKQLEDIKAIREIMEKSTKFISLSGLSGVVAGLAAIVGAFFAYYLLDFKDTIHTMDDRLVRLLLLCDALIVLVVSIGFGVFFSWRKSRKLKQKFFSKVTLKIVYHLSVPLVTGGIVSLIFLLRGDYEVISSLTLIFYGLALVNVSKFTLDEIHYLGLVELGLGILSAIFIHNGLIFWTIGFGVCHILYGALMYKKYDLNKR